MEARQVSMYLAAKCCGNDAADRRVYERIAEAFHRSVANVSAGVRRIEKERATQTALEERISILTAEICKSGVEAVAEMKRARTSLVSVLAAQAKNNAQRPPDVEHEDGIFSEQIIANAKAVRDYLNKIKFHFTEETEGLSFVFRGSICAEGDIIDVFQWKIAVEDESVQSFFTLPTHVKPERRLAVAEYCMYVNYPLKYGKLTEDIGDDGEVMFQLCVPAASLKGDPYEEVDRLMGLPTVVLERFTPGLIDVLQGRSPREAYEMCEDHDDDEEKTPGEIVDHVDASDDADNVFDGGTGVLHKQESSKAAEVARPTSTTDLAENYSLEGLNVQGDVPLAKVVAAVRKFRDAHAKGEDAPRMNILLSGPSGCGKTEFVKYLGREVGAGVMTISASDVLSPMVGRTEQKLAQLFCKARESKSILFLDEVDSLLSSRANASHSWEVTQVNELLQQMERFGGIMVGATNFESNLDSAVARRFTFKLKMDYLSEEGKRKFFTRYFKTPLTAEESVRLEAIPNLTPGDFRTARQKLYYLADKPSNESRLAALEAESSAKGARRARIGF